MMATWASVGTISLSARPMISAGRRSGVTSIRSCDPVCISYSRFEPVADVPNRQTITTMPGTNHCSADSPPAAAGSSGANRARKNSGWTMLKMTENGSRSTGRSSRTNTVRTSVIVSVVVVQLMRRSPARSTGRRWRRPRGGCGR
jgi:hypothetical protein